MQVEATAHVMAYLEIHGMQPSEKSATPRPAAEAVTPHKAAIPGLIDSTAEHWQSRSPANLPEESASVVAYSAAAEVHAAASPIGSGATLSATAAGTQQATVLAPKEMHHRHSAGTHIRFECPDGGVG